VTVGCSGARVDVSSSESVKWKDLLGAGGSGVSRTGVGDGGEGGRFAGSVDTAGV
jgi:hypothetical protein